MTTPPRRPPTWRRVRGTAVAPDVLGPNEAPAAPAPDEPAPGRTGVVRSFVLLGGSTAVGQLLLVVTTPLVTRIYTPAAIGLFTLYFTYVAFVQTGSSLMYSAAIPTAGTDGEALALTRLSFRLSIPYALLGAAVFLALDTFDVLGFGNFPVLAALLCVMSLALTGAFTTFRYLLVREQRYTGIARALFLQNAVRAGGQVGVGVVAASWWTMALSDLVGRAFGIGPGVRQLRRIRVEALPAARDVLRRYRSFPLVYLPSTLIDNLVVWLPLPLITARYGLVAGGLYAVVTRVVGVPLGVIGSSIADIFHGHFAAAVRDGGRPRRVFWRTAAVLAAIGVPIAVLMFTVSPPVFTAVLGSEWTEAGTLCAILAPWFLLQFVVSPLSRIILVFEAQAWKLTYDVIALAAIGVAYGVAVVGDLELQGFVRALTISAAVAYVVYLLILVRIVTTRGGRECAV